MTNTAHNDEIDLKDILRIIWKRKFWIAGFVIFVCAVTVFTVLKMDNIYESKAVLRPVQNSTNQMSSALSNLGGLANLAGISISNGGSVSQFNAMSAILSDDDFMFLFIRKYKFENDLFENYDKDSKKQIFKKNEKFYMRQELMESLSFSQDKKSGIITLSFKAKNRERAKEFVQNLLFELNNKYKTIDLSNIQQQIDNYKIEIDKTNDISIKNKLAEVISGLIQNKVLSQAQEYYGFDILVKPSVPDELNKVGPKRALICVAAFTLSLILAMVSAVVTDKIFMRRD